MLTSLNKILLKKINPTITIKNAGLIKGRVAIKTKGKNIFSFSKNKKSAAVMRKIDKDSVSKSCEREISKGLHKYSNKKNIASLLLLRIFTNL